MHDAVLVELKRRLAEVDRVDVSRYQFINMDSVKSAAGGRWDDLRRRAFLATRSMIERRVAEDDLIIPCATGFLVIYSALSGTAAERLTAKIRGEMIAFFLGDPDFRTAGVEATSEALSIAEFEAALAAADLDFEDGEPHAGEPRALPMDAFGLKRLSYAPAWDPAKEAVASYFVRPHTALEDQNGWSPDLSAQLSKPHQRLDFDLQVLETAAGALGRLIAAGSRCALITPAGYVSIARAHTRSRYVTALAALPADLRRLIRVRIEDAPSDAPAAQLGEAARILSRQAAQLFFHTRPGVVSLERYLEAGSAWVGAAIPARTTPSSEADLARFAAMARRGGAPVYFDECDRVDTVKAASRLGARLIAGAAIGSADAPAAPYRLPRDALFARAA